MLLCFSSAEQCPSATGSHNSLPVCAQRASTRHPALAISFSSSGPGPLPPLHPIVWVKAARAGLGPVQTYSSLFLVHCQHSLINVNFTYQINLPVVMKQMQQSLWLYIWVYAFIHMAYCTRACVMSCVGIHASTCVGETKSQSIMHSPRWASRCVCLSPSPVRREGWSVFSGRTPFG